MAKNPAVRKLIELIQADAANLKELYRLYGGLSESRFLCSHLPSGELTPKLLVQIIDRETETAYDIAQCAITEDVKGSKNLLWLDEDDLYELYKAGRCWATANHEAFTEHEKQIAEKSGSKKAFENTYLGN